MPRLFDDGEKLIIENIFESDEATLPPTVEVGLYDSKEDELGDDAVPGDITSEPGGASYERQTISFDSTGFTASQEEGDWQAETGTVEFDLSDDETGDVDRYFIVYDDDGDKLFFDGELSREYPLDMVDILEVERKGLSIT